MTDEFTDILDRISDHGGRSRLRPQPSTLTPSGSPIGLNISGLNMPELPTSTHLLRPWWKEKISSEGSV